MSPEQAKGKAVDRSADLWAFGALLYEMLTGTAAFTGETVTDVLAAIVMRDPDWSALPNDTPPGVARLLRRCLERDRRRRLADAGEARFLIEEALAAPAVVAAVGDGSRRPSLAMTLLPWALAAVLPVALVTLAWPRPTAPGAVMTHLSIEIPPRAVVSTVLRPAIAISPDGRSVVFVATLNGVDRLFVRTGDRFDARLLDGTEGASNPAMSPDGRWVAFVSGTQLYKMPIGGGPRIELAAVNNPRGVHWDAAGAILVTPRMVGGVVRVPSGGGAGEIVSTPVEGQERTHRWASTLPGGKAIIFTVGDFNNPDSYVGARIDALVLATGERKTLIPGAEMARYSPSGHLVFARAGALFAVAFDPDTLAVGDVTEAVLQGVSGDTSTGAVHFDISASGTLAYIPAGAEQALMRLAWVEKTGRINFLGVPPGAYSDPAVSPEGKRVAITVIAGGGRDISIFDADRGTFTRITFGGMSFTPAWSRDGRWIYYATLEPDDASATISRRVADGSREAETLVTLGHRLFLNAITADGLTALFDYSHAGTGGGSDIGVISLQSDAKARPFVSGRGDEYSARISPDGRWVAYESTESSRPEIYVRPADMTSSGRWPVSAAGGREPKWSRDGRMLYFRYGTELFAAPIDSGPGFQSRPPSRVLTDIYDLRNETAPRHGRSLVYDVHPDGRFMMIRPVDDYLVSNAIRLNLAWGDELRKIGSRR
jgi:eukaryotic-like serine/threonine-protein kinase